MSLDCFVSVLAVRSYCCLVRLAGVAVASRITFDIFENAEHELSKHLEAAHQQQQTNKQIYACAHASDRYWLHIQVYGIHLLFHTLVSFPVADNMNTYK